MGHWSTYRKRGGGLASPTLIPAPPAPDLVVVDGLLRVSSNVLSDVGGQFRLYGGAHIEGPFTLVTWVEWALVWQFDPADFEPWACYTSTEYGNGIVYLGESPFSQVTEF